MDESTRRISLRAVLALVAVVAVAAVFWAATAIAAGGSPNGEPGARDSPKAANVQNEGDRPDHDCPNRDGASGTSSDV